MVYSIESNYLRIIDILILFTAEAVTGWAVEVHSADDNAITPPNESSHNLPLSELLESL